MRMVDLTAAGWWDWSLGNVLSAAQLFFVLLGFAVAIWQLARTANATVASRVLLEKVRSRLIGNDLLLTLPDLHKLDDDLVRAVNGGTAAEVELLLAKYSKTATRIAAMLKLEPSSESEPLISLLNQAAKATQRAKSEISQGSERPVKEAAALALAKMTNVSAEAIRLIVRLEKKVGD